MRSQLVALVLVALTPALLLTLLTASQQRTALLERGAEQSQDLARTISASHGELIESARVLLATIAETPAIQERRADECVSMAQRIVSATTSYVALAATDAQGVSWCRYPQPESVSDYSDREYFQRVSGGHGFVVGGYQIGQVTQRRLITLALPVHDDQEQLSTILLLGLDVDELNRRVAALGLAPEYTVTLVDRSATVIIDWPAGGAETVGESLPEGALRQALLADSGPGPEPRILTGPGGTERLYAFRSVEHTPGQDLIIAVGIELEAALRPVDQSIALYVGLGSGLILLGGVAAWWFGERRLAQPIRSLARAARQIQSGRLDRRAAADGHASEIANLVTDFNAMADTLQAQSDALIAANQDLERRVENRTQRLRSSLDELRRSREQLRQLSGRQRQLLEAEQTRISREVHDQLGQALTGAKMDLALIERRLRGLADQPTVAEALETVRGLTVLMDETIQVARAIARRLRPSLLDDLGLAAAIEWMARDVAGRAGLGVNFTSDDSLGRLPDAIGTGAYRIAQEAVTNIVRHAQASTVTIALQPEADGLRLTITDDGIGLSAADPPQTSLGMLGMRERAEELGGAIDWEPGASGGTRLSAWLPLTQGPTAATSVSDNHTHAREA